MGAYPSLFMTITLVTLLAGKSLASESYLGPVLHRPVLKEECSKWVPLSFMMVVLTFSDSTMSSIN
jgi:ATP/ADP translocase